MDVQAGEGPGAAEVFERYRARLFGVAYRMLGAVADAEDVLQSAFLRWHQAGGAAVRNPEAWLVAVTTRLAIDRLRSAASERARYSGDWLPEPIRTAEPATGEERAQLASDLSMAFLVLLERLSPDERAALLLRDVFDADYAEIGRALDKGEAACRQIVHRARARIRDGRRRREVAPEAKERLLARFLAGLRAGDEQALLAVVADDAVWTSDGGGKVPAAHGVRGAARIVRFQLRLARKVGDRMRHEIVWMNGEPAVATWVGERLFSTLAVDTDGERLLAFYSVLNPDKLRHAARV